MKKNKKDQQGSSRPLPKKSTASTSSKLRRLNNKQGQRQQHKRENSRSSNHSNSRRDESDRPNSRDEKRNDFRDHMHYSDPYTDPYQFYHSRMYDGAYLQPPMWPPYYHPQFNYHYNSDRPSSSHNQQSSKDQGNYHSYYTMPPPLLPPNFGFFRNQNSNSAKPPEFPRKTVSASSNSKEDEPAPLGSEAARERERAEIANRLMGLETKKSPSSKEPEKGIQNKESNVPGPSKKLAPSAKPTKKINTPNSKQKHTDKPSKRPSASTNGSSSSIPSKKTNTNELDFNILRQITAMGKDEIRGIVNNPQSAKSQDILKALMKHYRELKGIELDKRRLLAPTASTSTQAYNSILSNVESIEIADLPMEIINQLNNFLGCDITGHEETPQSQEDEVVLLEPEPAPAMTPEIIQQEHSADVNGPYPEFQRTNDPEKILEELVMIDMRMQADLHRKMDLYRQLHEIMMKQSGEQPNGHDFEPQNQIDAGSSLEQPAEKIVEQTQLPPPPAPPLIMLSPTSSLMPTSVVPSASSSREDLVIMKPSSSNSKETTVKAKLKSKEGKKEKSKSSEKKSSPLSEKRHKPEKSRMGESTLAGIQTMDSERLEISLKKFKCEIYDMKVVDNNTIVLACSDHNLYGFDVNSGEKIYEYKGHVDVVTSVMPVSYWRGGIQEQIICSGGLDEHICIFGFKSQQCVLKYYVASSVHCLEYFNDLVTHSKLLYAGLKNGMIQIYDVEKFVPKGSLDCGNRAISAILATKEGPVNVLLVGAVDRTICLRDAQSGLYLRQYTYSFIATRFLLHGSTFFCQSTSNGVTSFNLNTGEYMGFMKTICPVSRIARLKNLLFVALVSGTIKVYNMNTRQSLDELNSKGKLLRYIDATDDKIVTAARVNDLVIIPFTSLVEES